MSVDVGLNLQNLPSDRIAEQVTDIAVAAERLGLHSLWVSEHIVLPAQVETKDPYNEGGRLPFEIDTLYPEAMVLLGYAAGVTTTLRLGTYVIPAIARDPLSLAKQAATVDVLSGGRLELGVGAGYLLEEADLLGHPRDHRAGRLAETIEIMRKAWAHPVFEHHGQYWDFPPVAVRPAPLQGDALPVWIGGTSPTALKTATTWGNGVLVPKATPDSVASIRAQVPATCRVAAGWHVGGDRDLANGRALRDAGADLLIVHAGTDAHEVVPALERLADEALSAL